MAFRTQRPSQQHGALSQTRTCAFLELPDELLLDIADLLGLSDLACLSLCSRDLNLKFARYRGPYHLHDRVAKGDFLVRLIRDHPSLFCCYDGLRLHSISLVPSPALTGLKPPEDAWTCITFPNPDDLVKRPHHIHGRFSAYNIAFQHIHLVMAGRLPLRQLKGLELQELSITPLRPSLTTTLLFVEARVVEGQLYLRVQQWVTFHSRELSRAESMWDVAICAHINWDVYHHRCTTLVDVLRCKLCHDEDGPYSTPAHCRTCPQKLRCTICKTEFQIDKVDLPDSSERAMVLTKWINLGRGIDLSERRWQLHLSRYVPRASLVPLVAQARQNVGARALFECGSEKKVSDLAQSNAVMLRPVSYLWSLKQHPASSSVRQIYIGEPRSQSESSKCLVWAKVVCLVTIVALAKMTVPNVEDVIMGISAIALGLWIWVSRATKNR